MPVVQQIMIFWGHKKRHWS